MISHSDSCLIRSKDIDICTTTSLGIRLCDDFPPLQGPLLVLNDAARRSKRRFLSVLLHWRGKPRSSRIYSTSSRRRPLIGGNSKFGLHFGYPDVARQTNHLQLFLGPCASREGLASSSTPRMLSLSALSTCRSSRGSSCRRRQFATPPDARVQDGHARTRSSVFRARCPPAPPPCPPSTPIL